MTSYLLGIQWESSAMRVACMRRGSSGKTTLLRVDTLTFPSDDGATRQRIFKDWLTQHVPAHAPIQAVLTVSESHIILKELELPVLKGQELTEAVYWELMGKTSIDSESATAWQVIEKRQDMLRVATMIMKKTEVAAAQSFFSDAGVELIAIEPTSLSAARIIAVPDTTCILLSLEGAEGSTVFMRAKVPVFSTSFTIPLTDTAARAKHLSREAAQVLASQLKRIIAYWNAKEVNAGNIIVFGELASYTGLKSDVARGLTVPLAMGEIKSAVAPITKAVSSSMAVVYAAVIGAALRSIKPESTETVNFLPKEHLSRLEQAAFGVYVRTRLWQFAKMNVSVLLLMGALSGFLWGSHVLYTKKITQTERFIQNHPAQIYVDHITSVNALVANVSTLIGSQQDTGIRLRYIASVTPPSMHFTTLKMASGAKEEWVITGSGNRADILSFYYKLKTDGQVREVTMPYTNFDRETDSPFTVTILW